MFQFSYFSSAWAPAEKNFRGPTIDDGQWRSQQKILGGPGEPEFGRGEGVKLTTLFSKNVLKKIRLTNKGLKNKYL